METTTTKAQILEDIKQAQKDGRDNMKPQRMKKSAVIKYLKNYARKLSANDQAYINNAIITLKETGARYVDNIE